MNNILCTSVLLSLCCLRPVYVFADYLNPPDWNDSNDFTHQSWDFLTDESGYLPAAPDGEPNWTNPFGTPGLIAVDYTDWRQGWLLTIDQYTEIESDRTGFYGGMGDTTLTFHIPNIEKEGFWQKQLWLQIVYWARKDGGQTYNLIIARDSNCADTNDIISAWLDLNDPNEDEGLTGKFYRLTAALRFEDQPGEEFLKFTAFQYPPEPNHTLGGASMVDQVSIDTRCLNLDLVEDGIINLRDYAVFAAEYQYTTPASDLHPDQFINKKDLSVLLQYWLQQYPILQ